MEKLKKRAIIGLGNVLKKDDNIGNVIVSQLEKTIPDKNFIFIQAGIAPENFIFSLKKQNPERIYFIDAVEFNGKVGEVKTFAFDEISTNRLITTHNIPVKFFKKFFPRAKINLIGIEVKEIDFGEGFSKGLEQMLPRIINKVREIILQ